MRILVDGHSLGTNAGGNESYVRGLLEGFSALPAGENLELLVCVNAAVPLATLPANTGGRDDRVRYIRLRSTTSSGRLLVEIPRLLRQESVDVAHFQYVAPPRHVCPTVLCVHDASFLQAPRVLGLRTATRLRFTNLWSLRSARALLVPSSHVAGALCRRYSGVHDKVRVVPLAASRDFHHQPRSTDMTRRRALGLPSRYLLYVGRRERRKNLRTLLRAFAVASRRVPTLAPLCLVGPVGSEDRALRRLAGRLGIGHRVLFVPFVPRADLPAVYRGAEVVLFPGLCEGFGLPVLEAMACGVPALASADGAVPETSRGAVALARGTTDEDWAEAIIQVARDPFLRQRLARAGLREAATKCWVDTARRTAEAYAVAVACPAARWS